MAIKFKLYHKYINQSGEDPQPEYLCVDREFDAKRNKSFVTFRNGESLVILFVRHHKNGDEYTNQFDGFYKISAKDCLE